MGDARLQSIEMTLGLVIFVTIAWFVIRTLVNAYRVLDHARKQIDKKSS